MPGATLEDVEDSVFSGRIKVRAGPMQITYRGSVELTEADAEARRAVLAAAGKDTKSAGTARADVVAEMEPDGDGTMVTVQAQVDVTGKPAQFGRSVMEEVGANIISQFAGRLENMILEDSTGAGAPSAAVGPTPVMGTDDALDLLDVVGPKTKRLVVATVIAVVVVAWLLSRRR
jgi:carbon monoxide dehydrogenase subunit G